MAKEDGNQQHEVELSLSERNKKAIMETFNRFEHRFDEQHSEIQALKATIARMNAEIITLKQGIIMANVNRGSGATS